MDDNLVPFTTILAVEGTPTSDGRLLQLGGMSTRQVPLPIMAQMVNPEAGGHTGSVLVGKIENIESDGERVMGKGVIDTNTEYGKRVVDLLKSQTLRFVSIDIGAAEFEQDDSPEAVAPMVFTNYEVMGATIVPFPALPGAVIWLDGTDEPPEMTRFTPLFDKVRSLGFNPDQERDENGRWGSGGGKSYDWEDKIKLEIGEPKYKYESHLKVEERMRQVKADMDTDIDETRHAAEREYDELKEKLKDEQASAAVEPTKDAIVAELKKYSDQIYVESDSSGVSASQYITVYPFSEEKALAAIDDIGTIEFLAPEQEIKIRISDHELPSGYKDAGGDIVLFTKEPNTSIDGSGFKSPERVVEKVLTKFDVKPNNLTAAFNPDQERDANGRWGSSGSKSNAIKSATGDKKQSYSSNSAKEKIIADLVKTPEYRKAEWGSTKKEVFGSLRGRFPDVEFKGERSKHTLDELTAAAAGIALVAKEFPAVIGSISLISFGNGRGGNTTGWTQINEEGIEVKFLKQPEDGSFEEGFTAIQGPNDVMAFGTAVHEMFHVAMATYTVNHETNAGSRLSPIRGPIGSEGEFSSIRDFRKNTLALADPERTGLKFEPVSKYAKTLSDEAAAEGLSYSIAGFPKDKNDQVSQDVFDYLKASKPIRVDSDQEAVRFSNGRGVRVPAYLTDWQERKADGMVASIGEQNDFETLSLVQTTEFVEGTWIWDFVHAANSLTAAFSPDQERDENGKWTSSGGSNNDTDYDSRHSPDPDGPPAHDLFGEDSYAPPDLLINPQNYTAFPEMLEETMATLNSIDENPDQKITVWRATPEMNMPSGSWVTLSKDYAIRHAESQGMDDDEYLVEGFVKAKDVRWAGDDLMEWGYFPNSLTAAFSPNQERDKDGKWTSGGGSDSEPVSELLDSVASGEKIEIRPDQVSIVLAEMAKKSNEGKDFNACEISVPGTNLFCEDSIGTERADMPQIKGTAREGSDAEKIANKHGKVDGTEAFRESLKASGIAIKDIDSVPVVSLKASQTELIGSKVGGMMKAIEHGKIDLQDERIFVSKDGYILDGHHRWAAAIGVEAKDGKLNDNDITMNVTRVDANIKELIPLANEFAADFGIIPKPGA